MIKIVGLWEVCGLSIGEKQLAKLASSSTAAVTQLRKGGQVGVSQYLHQRDVFAFVSHFLLLVVLGKLSFTF